MWACSSQACPSAPAPRRRQFAAARNHELSLKEAAGDGVGDGLWPAASIPPALCSPHPSSQDHRCLPQPGCPPAPPCPGARPRPGAQLPAARGPLGPRTPRRMRRPSVLEPGGPGLTRACGRPARSFARACKCLHVTESEMDFYE